MSVHLTAQRPKVIVEVQIFKPDGTVRSTTKQVKELPPDMILIQFRDYLEALMGIASNPGSASTTMRDTSNTIRNLNYRGDGSTCYLQADTRAGLIGGKLSIGDDATPPARTNYAMVSEVAEFAITSQSLTESTIVKQGAWLATGSGTVRETGYYLYLSDTAGVLRKFLLFRDTPTPQAYNTNDSIQVTYTIQL